MKLVVKTLSSLGASTQLVILSLTLSPFGSSFILKSLQETATPSLRKSNYCAQGCLFVVDSFSNSGLAQHIELARITGLKHFKQGQPLLGIYIMSFRA